MQTHNNFIITGITRSGTTLFCNLVNRITNVICFNEVLQAYNIAGLPDFFLDMRGKVHRGEPVLMDVDSHGQLITDSQTQTDHAHREAIVALDKKKPLFIGSKVNSPYLINIREIKSFNYVMFAIIRDPVYTIASWNMHRRGINEAHVMPQDWQKWPRYSQVHYSAGDKYGRQAEIWNMLADIILANFPQDHIYRYENIVSQTQYWLMYFCSQLSVVYDAKDLPVTENRNIADRHDSAQLYEIREAVRQYAPLALELGYRV